MCIYYICVYIAIALHKRSTGCSNLSETHLIPLPPSPTEVHRHSPRRSIRIWRSLEKWHHSAISRFQHPIPSHLVLRRVKWVESFVRISHQKPGGEFKVQVVVSFMNIKLEDWWYLENSWVNTCQYIFGPAFIDCSLTKIALCPICERWW